MIFLTRSPRPSPSPVPILDLAIVTSFTPSTFRNLKARLTVFAANLVDISKDILEAAREINGVKLITKKFDNLSIDELRKISDEIKAKSNNIAMVFATVKDSKVTFLMSLTDDIVQRGYHAEKMNLCRRRPC